MSFIALSVVVPMYNEQTVIPAFAARLRPVSGGLDVVYGVRVDRRVVDVVRGLPERVYATVQRRPTFPIACGSAVATPGGAAHLMTDAGR